MTSRGTRRPTAGRLPQLVASALTALVLAACSASGDSPSAASRAVSTSAAGPGTHPSGVDVTFDLARAVPSDWESRRATIEHVTDDASWSVRLDANGTPAFVSVPASALPGGMHHYRFSGRFRVRSRAADQSVGLATVENSAGEHHADLFVDRTSGRCRVDLFQDDTAMSPDRCDDGAWHRVTMQGDFGAHTYTLAWTVDGRRMPAIRSVAQPPATVHRVWLGDATPAKTNVTDWADVHLELRPS